MVFEGVQNLIFFEKNQFSKKLTYGAENTLFLRKTQILRTQWYQLVRNYKKVNQDSSIESVEFGTLKSSHWNSQSSFQHNRETNTKPLSKNKSRNVDLFQELLKNASDLLHAMNEPHLLTFRDIIQSIVVDIESILSNINIDDPSSINNAKEVLTSLKIKCIRTFRPNRFTSTIYQINQTTKQSYSKTIKAINALIEYFTNYQIQTVKNQTKNLNQSSASLSITDKKQLTNKNSIQSFKRKSENSHADNYDQSEILSCSSVKIESSSQYTKNTNKRKFNKLN
ncbi:unnamed protein product [Rotaria sp. Silwood2]|nr:unnamed protein product [Rotaria sp. Silwood2]